MTKKLSNSFQTFALESFPPMLERDLLSRTVEHLAKSVLCISDSYNSDSGPMPVWSRVATAEAYMAYFFPLNALRLKSVIAEAIELGFFTHINKAVDFGSGPGTAQFAALECGLETLDWTFIEQAPTAMEMHQRWLSERDLKNVQMTWTESIDISPSSSTVGVFSYSLNEIGRLPGWAFDCEALILVEPSQSKHSRALQSLREVLMQSGFHIWAPCTHGKACPLLTHSKTDWCHTRIHIQPPSITQEVERHLPMRNRTLTYSYLLARKSPPPARVHESIRIIGDTLREKGKIRQAICRGPDREFLSWLTRKGEPEPIERGRRMAMPEHKQIGGELRVDIKD